MRPDGQYRRRPQGKQWAGEDHRSYQPAHRQRDHPCPRHCHHRRELSDALQAGECQEGAGIARQHPSRREAGATEHARQVRHQLTGSHVQDHRQHHAQLADGCQHCDACVDSGAGANADQVQRGQQQQREHRDRQYQRAESGRHVALVDDSGEGTQRGMKK